VLFSTTVKSVHSILLTVIPLASIPFSSSPIPLDRVYLLTIQYPCYSLYLILTPLCFPLSNYPSTMLVVLPSTLYYSKHNLPVFSYNISDSSID